jgi:hypothetical protein
MQNSTFTARDLENCNSSSKEIEQLILSYLNKATSFCFSFLLLVICSRVRISSPLQKLSTFS